MKTLIVVPSGEQEGASWGTSVDREYDTLHIDYRSKGALKPFSMVHIGPTGAGYGILNIVGQKWAIVKTLLNDHWDSLNQYDYIGFWDDDLIAEARDINKAIIVADAVNAKMWQMSLSKDSDCHYSILIQNPAASLYRTNFIEIMAPFYHKSLLPKLRDFLNMYDVSTGWGLDVVGPHIFDEKPVVIHSYSITHPKKAESAYDKSAAFAEQEECFKAYRKLADQFGLRMHPEQIGQVVHAVF